MRLKDLALFIIALISVIFLFFPFFWVLSDVVVKGIQPILNQGFNFLISPPPFTNEGLGGIGTVLEGTLILVVVAGSISIPLGLMTGVFLGFYPNNIISKITQQLVESIVEFPTVVIGISVFGVLILDFGFKISVVTGSVALAIIMLPYIIMQISDSIYIPRQILEETLFSLGFSRSRTVLSIISASRRGILTGILLGLAKGFGESAALLFTVATSFNLYFSGLGNPVSAIPVLIYFYAQSPYSNWQEVAWGASLVLAIIVLSIFVISRLLIRGGLGK
ncbi:phosphate ABC transporter permease [Sulfolobus acidocaldarius SUSAZ]|nr:phosphate ABC transporter permease [Sulfolobus acidocaldarius SUSAZ]